MTSDRHSPADTREGVMDWKKRRHFVHHHDAERFDQVTIDTVERWKESELSGDEWRFSHIVRFWRRGKVVAQCSAASIEDACLVAAYQYTHVNAEGPYLGDISEACCQPACPKPWVVLMHPIKRYSARGEELTRPYNEGDVRGFCERHRHRGDCGLDDADVNYVVVEERPPPEWFDPQQSDGSSDGKQFEVGYLYDEEDPPPGWPEGKPVTVEAAGWYATARYKGALLKGEGDHPAEACERLAARILHGGQCVRCQQSVNLVPERGRWSDGNCNWHREGKHWLRGCDGGHGPVQNRAARRRR